DDDGRGLLRTRGEQVNETKLSMTDQAKVNAVTMAGLAVLYAEHMGSDLGGDLPEIPSEVVEYAQEFQGRGYPTDGIAAGAVAARSLYEGMIEGCKTLVDDVKKAGGFEEFMAAFDALLEGDAK